MMKRTPLTEVQFKQLDITTGWELTDVHAKYWDKIPGLERRDEIVAVLASGCYTETRVLNAIEAVAGMDVLVHESNPRENEPEGNAYHYVIQQTCRKDFPYILTGPFKSETRVKHWYEADDLDTYWKEGS